MSLNRFHHIYRVHTPVHGHPDITRFSASRVRSSYSRSSSSGDGGCGCSCSSTELYVKGSVVLRDLQLQYLPRLFCCCTYAVLTATVPLLYL